MDNKIRKKIIDEYKKGKSSLQIVKIVGLSKPTILKVLNDERLVRKRDRCKSLNIKQDERGYYVVRTCPKCKKEIRTYSKEKTIACRNHINSLNNNCKSCSLQLQVGKGNPFYGKKHTKESKNKISNSRKGKAVGEHNSMSNLKWREKASKNLKLTWASGKLEKTRNIMSEHMKKTLRSGKIKSFNTSKKEKQIINFLKKYDIDAIQSYKVDTKICDIFIPSMNLIIEYFGDYWHCNPQKYDETYLNKKKGMTAKQIWEYDRRKIDLIINCGYNLEVIWESDLKHNNKKIIETLNKYDSKNRFAPERS